MRSWSRMVAMGVVVGAACLASAAGSARVLGHGAHEGAQADSSNVKRGEFLVGVAACTDCHTPWKMGPNGPEPDATRYLSGHPESEPMGPPPAPSGGWLWAGSATNTAFAGPWGVSYAINLTPDATGLGQWTEEMFVSALKTGKHAGVGRPILPPMPWTAYREMSDDDLKAMFSYLKSITPIKNTPPAAELPR